MRRIGPSSGMRCLMLLLVFLAGYTASGTAQEVDDAAIEINPLDYVPLAVGNRWTYGHYHWNNTYLQPMCGRSPRMSMEKQRRST